MKDFIPLVNFAKLFILLQYYLGPASIPLKYLLSLWSASPDVLSGSELHEILHTAYLMGVADCLLGGRVGGESGKRINKKSL